MINVLSSNKSLRSLHNFEMSNCNKKIKNNEEKLITGLRFSHIGEMTEEQIRELIVKTEGFYSAEASVKSLQSVESNLRGAQEKVQELIEGLISFKNEVKNFNEPTLKAKADAFLTKLQSLINTPSPTGGFLFGGTDKPIKHDLTTFLNLDKDGKPIFELCQGLPGTIRLAGQNYSMSNLRDSVNQIITAVNNFKGVYTKDDGTQGDIIDATGAPINLETRKANAEVAFQEAFNKLSQDAMASLVETRQEIKKSIDPMKKELQQWQNEGRDQVQFNDMEKFEIRVENDEINFKMQQILELMMEEKKSLKSLFDNMLRGG